MPQLYPLTHKTVLRLNTDNTLTLVVDGTNITLSVSGSGPPPATPQFHNFSAQAWLTVAPGGVATLNIAGAQFPFGSGNLPQIYNLAGRSFLRIGDDGSQSIVTDADVISLSSNSIGGIPIGTPGTGFLAGYTLRGGEDFADSTAVMLLRPGQPYGRLTPNFSERDRRLTSTSSMHAVSDPYWTGWQDANDGVPIASLSDMVVTSGSVMTQKARLATGPEQALFGTRVQGGGPAYTNRPIASTGLTLMGSYAVRGDRWAVIRWRANPGFIVSDAANVGQAIWTLNVRGGSEAGDDPGAEYNDELDVWESAINVSGVFGTATARTAVATQNQTTFGAVNSGAWNVTRVHWTPTSTVITNFNDAGTQLGTGTLTNNATNLDQLFYWMFDVIATPTNAVNSAVFDVTRWQTGTQSSLDIDYIQEWLPSASAVLTPALPDAAPTVIPLNTAGSIVLPSAVSLWGQVPDAEYLRFQSAYDTNGPGRPQDQVASMMTRDALPTGVTYNAGTRTISFDTTFSTQAGMIVGYLYPKLSSSGLSKPYKFVVYVGPKCTVPYLQAPVAGSPYSYVIPRSSGTIRYWDNGNCPNGQHSGLTLVSGPPWLSYDPVTRTLSGNCPVGFTSATLTFRCTNGAGISTDTTTLFGVATAYQPSDLTGLLFAGDTTDVVNTPDNGSGRCVAFQDIYAGAAKKFGRSVAASGPTIITNGGPSGTARLLRLATANAEYLDAGEGAGMASVIAMFNNADTRVPNGYWCFAYQVNATGVTNRILYFSNAGDTSHFTFRNNATGTGLNIIDVSAATNVFTQELQDAAMDVIQVTKSGATINVYKNGAKIVDSATLTLSGAMANTLLQYGGFNNVGTKTGGLNGNLGSLVMASAVPTAAQLLADYRWVASRAGVTV